MKSACVATLQGLLPWRRALWVLQSLQHAQDMEAFAAAAEVLQTEASSEQVIIFTSLIFKAYRKPLDLSCTSAFLSFLWVRFRPLAHVCQQFCGLQHGSAALTVRPWVSM